jgi:predicted component of type VI protein secretion system
MAEETTPDVAEETSNEVPMTPLLEAILRPIPGDSPTGIKVNYDDDFLRLKAEINKIGAVSTKVDQEKALEAMADIKKAGRKAGQLSGGEAGSLSSGNDGVDYELIVDRAQKILGEKSKDLVVLSYATFGLATTKELVGMAEGIRGFNLMIDTYWEGLFPPIKKMSARRNAFLFLTDKLGERFENIEVTLEDREPLEQIEAELGTLQTSTMQLMADKAPVFSGIMKQVKDTLKRVPQPEVEDTGEDTSETESDDSSEELNAEGTGTGAGTRILKVASLSQDGNVDIDVQYAEAKDWLAKGNLRRALATIRKGAEQDTSQKDRFMRQLYTGALCVKGRQFGMARMLLEDLEDHVTRHELDIWDPNLVIELWANQYVCLQSLARDAEEREAADLEKNANVLFQKLCLMNAERALRVLNEMGSVVTALAPVQKKEPVKPQLRNTASVSPARRPAASTSAPAAPAPVVTNTETQEKESTLVFKK